MSEQDFDALPNPGQQVMPEITPPQEVKIQDILLLAKSLEETIEEIEKKEQDLKKLEERKKRISEVLLPDIMGQIGMTEFRMTSGRKIRIKPDIYASAPEARMERIVAWLTERNMASIVKTKPSIHPSTLKSFVKEQLAADPQFPRELFGVHEVQKAVISD